MLRIITLVCFMLCIAVNDGFSQNFQVQIASYPDSVPLSEFKNKGFTAVFENVDQNGIHRYFAGAYTTREEAEEVQRNLFEKGYESSTIIDLEEQRALCGVPCPYFKGTTVFTQDPAQSTTVKNIYFDYNKSELNLDAREEINNLFKILKQNPNSQLKILAYTDAIGTPGYNIELAKSRGRAARNYLVEKGIHADRMYIKVYGELDPVKPNNDAFGKDSPEGRRWNRRVVLAVVNPDGEIQTETGK